jgi:hypothetical protein
MIGPELIGFVSASLVSDGVYTISTLLRGLRGTNGAMSTHEINEHVFFIDDGADLLNRTYSDLGRQSIFKVVAPGEDIDDIIGFKFTHVLGSVMPFPPWNPLVTYDGSNNITLTWYRRSRAISGLFGPAATPNIDITGYSVEVWDANDDVVRTIETTSETASYTAAQQTTDGFTPGNAIKFAIWQKSDAYGRGEGIVQTLGGPGAPVS